MSLQKEVLRYSKANAYEISKFYSIVCACKNDRFQLYSDDDEGAAAVVCTACDAEIDIENSRQYFETVSRNICNCDNEALQVGVGLALYEGTDETRWVYVGAQCEACGLNGVYADWQER